MFLSVASYGWVLMLAGQASTSTAGFLREVSPGVATLLVAGRSVGPAALISADGLFVVSLSSITDGTYQLRLNSGELVGAAKIAEDRLSQLALLRAEGKSFGVPVGEMPDFSRNAPGFFAISADGIVKVDVVSSHKLGLAGPARRLVPMCEVRFAGTPDKMRTALFFQGRTLIGPMLTSLRPIETQAAASLPTLGFAQNYGPDPLSVGFVPGPDVLLRVLDGFRSPSHHVSHPYLGVLCKDAIGAGAQVVKVVEGSAAERVGIRVGDVILGIGSATVRDHVDFAQAMFRQKTGERVTLLLKRGPQPVVAIAIVGDSSED